MAEVFKHPLTLVCNAGKSLVVNGVDIFTKVFDGIEAYNKSDFFNFGKNIGGALAELLLANADFIDSYDEGAYYFVNGFLKGANIESNSEALYNHIDGLGTPIFSPVQKAMRTY